MVHTRHQMLFVIKLRTMRWVGHVADMEEILKGRDRHLEDLRVHWMIILSRDRVTIDGFGIGNWIYWTLTARDYTLQITTTHRHVAW
jgi:hypothetical protein